MGGSNSVGGMNGLARSAHAGGQHEAQCTWSLSERAYANLFREYSVLRKREQERR